MNELSLKKWDVLLATWFGSGLLKPGPGTWGSLAALPFVSVVSDYGFFFMILAIAVLYALGHFSINSLQARTQSHDAGHIVIDEVIGMFVVGLFINGSWLQLGIAFLLFRVFDIIKPWPINAIEKKYKGAFGVIIDDIIAGLFAGILILIGRIFGFV